MTKLTHQQDNSPKKIAYIIYVLYLAGVLLPILPLVGIAFAYVFENDAADFLKSHYQYLIRSFWIGILYFGVASALVLLLVGFILIPLCLIWWLIRSAKGLKYLLRDEAVASPTTWLF